MLLRPAYLGITNAFALLPGSDRDKDTEILALRHQIAVLHRQLSEQRVRSDQPTGHGWPRCCTNSQTQLAPPAAAGAARHDPAPAS
ncbi:hypothetical protein [Dactylosporangium sp. NPDC048998]|uniref:hypothetical protein n=1 Tax=Dactylosporangium sp. NPDC048998 TaxID=3363976 RepID=UPI003722B32A